MPENKSRFVLVCQQSLALGVVVALTAPAASVVSLDIVKPSDGALPHASSTDTGTRVRPVVQGPDDADDPSLVATEPVRPEVSTVPLGGVSTAGLRALDEAGADRPGSTAGSTTGTGTGSAGATASLASAGTGSGPSDLAALSAPQHVAGLATVGVTWAPGTQVPDQAITVSVRTREDAAWSTWKKVPYHQDEGPDPSSAEGQGESPGTDPIFVGKVDDVQVRALTETGRVPVGMKISLVDPGHQQEAVQHPDIDTDGLRLSSATTGSSRTSAGTQTASLASSSTRRPRIFSRRQWGADERMRDRSSLHYGEVHGGFVHHTVNANGYTRAQVPALIRGIYAYHTQSRGWSDVGYNFLVDRFGRIWEGRYGGVGRPVVGAHTLGYNDDAFAMSAIGNFETRRPSAAMLRAYGRLFAWKLGLHGVRAGSSRQWITDRYLRAIDGHRDVGQTACPGRYLYARIPTIRRLAAADQRSFRSRHRRTNLVGIHQPDIVVRNKHTHQLALIRTDHRGRAGRVTPTGTHVRYADKLMSAGDWNGDGHVDVISRSRRTGLLYLYRGNGRGRFAEPVRMSRRSFGSTNLLASVGDMTGDRHPDLIGQPNGRSMRIYPGNGRGGFKPSYVAYRHVTARRQLGVNLWTSDGAPDTVMRLRGGRLVVYYGNGPGGLVSRHSHTVGSARGYDWLLPVGDLTGDGRLDLVGRSARTGRLWVLPRVSGGLGARRPYSGDMRRFDLAG